MNQFLKIMSISALAAALATSCGRKEDHRLSDECVYSPDRTVFTVWSAPAEKVELRLYDGTDDPAPAVFEMKKDGEWWTAEVEGDLKGMFYTFRSRTDGKWNEENPGIFAKAVGLGGDMAAVIDFRDTDPEGWEQDRGPALADPVDAIVYEMHLRDFTMDEGSGIAHKGKFLALAEEGVRTADSQKGGLDHLKELGITHVQILPCFDYASVDESALEKNVYNWGYDPKNYNVPEGSYSSDPADPEARIREMKTAVLALHSAGIGVIMDVVYNHTYDALGCALGRLTPGYFYRMDGNGGFANGSGCGNETASEKEMMRRFIVESVCWWASEYHIDGFRFDLMGIHDIGTMEEVRDALREIKPDILIYGEGWSATAPAYPAEKLAMKANMASLPGIGAFSDDIRDALVGSPFTTDGGLASGFPGNEERLRFGLTAALGTTSAPSFKGWTASPGQHVSYVTCHDNYCLRDRLALACPDADEKQLIEMDKLAQTAVLTSQGMPFIFAGEEMFRTKGGEDNSFESPDSVNAIRWSGKALYRGLYDYYRGLIAIRKAHPGFRLGDAEAVREKVSFPESGEENVVIYRIDSLEGIDPAASLSVIFNGNSHAVKAEVPEGIYDVLARDGMASSEPLGTIHTSEVTVAPRSAIILAEAGR